MDDRQIAAAGFTPAPSWASPVGQLGQWLVLAAALAFLTAAALNIFGRNDRKGTWAFGAGSCALFGAGVCLGSLFLGDQFQFQYVAEHSWKDLAPWYKVAAVWSGQQGSFLLWATTSAIFGLLAMRNAGPFRRWFVAVYSLFLASLSGILCYETPFSVFRELQYQGTTYVPPNGQGLVASLQNYWVVIHPPTIFMGFGSLAVLFAYSMSAMLTGDLKAWIPKVRPFALVSLSILGLGLVMGGLWAYETQGWGGFWAWDPVENVSLVPWLLVAAFIHGMIVQTTQGRWLRGNLMLGAAPFLLFFYGTFLTRSGFLNKFSLHSFAEMNRTALWILLAGLVVAATAFTAVWLTKGHRLTKKVEADRKQEGFNREIAYQTGVIVLSALAVSIAIGMSIPFFLGLLGKDAKVVEEPLYNKVVFWFFVPVMALMAAGPFISWRKMAARQFWKRFLVVVFIALWVVAGAYFLGRGAWSFGMEGASIDLLFGMTAPRLPWVMFLFVLTAVVAVGNTWQLADLFKRSKLGIGGFVAHIGVALLMAGLILSRGLERGQELLVMAGSPGNALGYKVSYLGMTSNPMADRANKIEFAVQRLGDDPKATFVARPGFFFNQGENGNLEPFTWPHIERRLFNDVYLSLAAPLTNLWEEPQRFHVGETREGEGVSITYLGFERKGQPGMPGTVFSARLKVVEDGKPYFASPILAVGMKPNAVPASPSLRATLTGIDPADHSILLQMPYTSTLFPMKMFYKPMTILVWVGTVVMTLGGLIAALYRRRSDKAAAA